jgi:hypothetical protein
MVEASLIGPVSGYVLGNRPITPVGASTIYEW